MSNRPSTSTSSIGSQTATATVSSASTSSTGSHTATALVSSALTSTVTGDLTLTTVTLTAAPSTTAATSPNLTTCPNTPSSKEPIAVGVGIGVPLGLALLGAAALIWRQRSRELEARKAASDWQEKYNALRETKRGDWTGGVERQMQEIGSGVWSPSEADGSMVHEVATTTR